MVPWLHQPQVTPCASTGVLAAKDTSSAATSGDNLFTVVMVCLLWAPVDSLPQGASKGNSVAHSWMKESCHT